jgi:hypothetical protein
MSDGEPSTRRPLPESLTNLFSRYLSGELTTEEYTAAALATLHPEQDED